MATGLNVGAFTEGFLSGMDRSQLRDARALAIEKERRAAEQEEKALELGERISNVNPEELNITPQYRMDDTDPGGINELVQDTGAQRIQKLRNEVNALPEDERNARTAQLNDVVMRGAILNIGMARKARADPNEEVKFLNAAAETVGAPPQFYVDETGKTMSEDGPVDERSYTFLLHYAQDPEKAYEWLTGEKRAQRGEVREDRELTAKEAESAQNIESAKQLDAYRWGALGVDQQKVSNDYEIELGKLEIARKTGDAEAAYLTSRAAMANATAKSLGQPVTWKNASDYIAADKSIQEEVANFGGQEFTQDWLNEHNVSMPLENFQQSVGSLARETGAEHGIEGVAGAFKGSLAVMGYLFGDNSAGITRHGMRKSNGKYYAYIDDPTGGSPPIVLPISGNAAMEMLRFDNARATEEGAPAPEAPPAPAAPPVTATPQALDITQ